MMEQRLLLNCLLAISVSSCSLLDVVQETNPKTFNLTFDVSETDSDTIETFLDARGVDGASFTYTVPGESSMSFVCLNWRKQIPFLNRSTITATFRQVFEP